MTRPRGAIACGMLCAMCAFSAAAPARDEPEPLVEVEPGLYEGDTVLAVTDVQYATVTDGEGAERALLFDAVFPADVTEPLPVAVFMHGGAWQRGSRADGHAVIGPLARAGFFALSIDYRLVPERYPAALDDVYAALRFVTERADALHVDPDRIVLIGSTAGGHLATLAALAANDERAPDDAMPPRPRVRAAIALSGSTDFDDPAFGDVAQRVITAWAGAHRTIASPINHVDADDPAVLLVHATNDPLVPFAQAERLAARLRDAGATARVVAIESDVHGVPFESCRDAVFDFLAAHVTPGPPPGG